MALPTPLKGKRLEQKAKLVVRATGFADNCGVMHDSRLRWQFNHLVDCITNGFTIPAEYYSDRIDKQGDRLLKELGVKHLHLNGSGSDIIVYLVEYDTWVELIEINTHLHLESEPRGKSLKGRVRLAAAVAAGAAAGAAAAQAASGKRRRRRKRKAKPPQNSN